MNQYKVWLDGGANNKTKDDSHAYGSYLFINQQTQKHTLKRIDHGVGLTSNDAEWLTLISVLKMLQETESAKVELFMDSQLIINQFNGKWRCKNARMMDYRIEAWNIRADLDTKDVEIKLDWISGDDMKMMVGH